MEKRAHWTSGQWGEKAPPSLLIQRSSDTHPRPSHPRLAMAELSLPLPYLAWIHLPVSFSQARPPAPASTHKPCAGLHSHSQGLSAGPEFISHLSGHLPQPSPRRTSSLCAGGWDCLTATRLPSSPGLGTASLLPFFWSHLQSPLLQAAFLESSSLGQMPPPPGSPL